MWLFIFKENIQDQNHAVIAWFFYFQQALPGKFESEE